MHPFRSELAHHPDRLRWNDRYGAGFVPSFAAHPVAAAALSKPLPDGPVLELASGPSGSALLAAAAGRPVTAVDASDVALGLLVAEARSRHLDSLITLVHADVTDWIPEPEGYSLVLCTGFWDSAVFAAAARAVAARGLLGWEALTTKARELRPDLPAQWCLAPGEPASLLPSGFAVLDQHDVPGSVKRRLLARRS
jgi:SAM-dependent methyltransferase